MLINHQIQEGKHQYEVENVVKYKRASGGKPFARYMSDTGANTDWCVSVAQKTYLLRESTEQCGSFKCRQKYI